MAQNKIVFEILKPVATLSDTGISMKEANIIRFADLPVCLDIRRWTVNGNGEKRMQRGVTLNPDELAALMDVLADGSVLRQLEEYRTPPMKGVTKNYGRHDR